MSDQWSESELKNQLKLERAENLRLLALVIYEQDRADGLQKDFDALLKRDTANLNRLIAATARADEAVAALTTVSQLHQITLGQLAEANARADAAELADNRNADPVILHDMELMDRRIEELESQLTTETARADGLQSALSAAEKQYQDAIAEVAIYMDRAERADDLMDALTAANARADAAEAKIKRAREVLPASWLTDYFDDKPEYCNNHANMTLLDGV